MSEAFHWAGGTDPGRVRGRNEDAWAASTVTGRRPDGQDATAWFLAVADGMGGLPGGDIASRTALQAFADGLSESQTSSEALSDETPQDMLRALFRRARRALEERARADPSLDRMGTAVSLVLVRSDGAWVGHLGDCRILWIRGDAIALATADHSAAWESVQAGRIDPEEAERDPMGSFLTRHLGPHVTPRPDLSDHPLALEAGDRLLLCSDGLGKVVGMRRVLELTRGRAPSEAIRALIDETIRGGAPDNVTVVLAEASRALRPPDAAAASTDWSSLPYRWKL